MVDEITASMKELQQGIDEAKKKRDHLLARLNVAQMRQRQAEARATSQQPGKDHLGDTSAFDTFDRMGERIEREEAVGEAHQEMAAEFTPEDTTDLDKASKQQSAEDALAALKKKMGAGS